MAKLQAFLFDVDGTLSDTERDGHRVAFNLAFEAAGLGWHWDETLYGDLLAVTGGKERIKLYCNQFNTVFEQPDDMEDFVKKLHASKTDFYTQLLSEGKIPLRPGVERLIHEARDAGMRLAIVTTTTPENVTALLTHTLGEGSESWFEVIAAGDIVPAKKPAADIYQWALQQLNLRPDETLAFEDSANGILSSTGANVRTIITINEYTKDDDFSDAALVLDHLGEADQPFTVLTGNAFGHHYMDMDLAHKVARGGE